MCCRVVCDPCSLKRLVLASTTTSSSVSTTASASELQRVCDGCYETLTTKQQAKSLATVEKVKKEALLTATSAISDSLIRVFLLDGSFKTVSFDESTTAADLAAKICFSVRMALFEVVKDLRNPDEFTLVPENECIVNLTGKSKRDFC